MHLVRPTVQYKQSFLKADNETFAADGRHLFGSPKLNADAFEVFCQTLNNYEAETLLPEDKVPASFFWLIDNNEFIGRISIRHRLNDELLKYSGHIGYIIAPQYRKTGYGTAILKLALQEATKLGLQKILVACDHTNIASAKIIERNGGVFENEVMDEEKLIRKVRYWINTAAIK